MKKQYVYARENIQLLALLLVILGVPMLIFSIFMTTKVKEVGYMFLIVCIIFFAIIIGFFINRFKWRLWHKKIKLNGVKFDGKVIKYNYKYKKSNLHHDPATLARETYWLEIMYTDNNSHTKTFETPELSFAPEERKDVACDVYVYNNEILATNFINLNKKKVDWQEFFYYIIIGAIFLGICIFIAWLKK